MQREAHQEKTFIGILTPMEWSNNGHITKIGISTYGEQEFQLEGGNWKSLLSLLKKTVEIAGVQKNNCITINKIKEYDFD